MTLCDGNGNGDEKMLVLTGMGTGMDITSAGTDGDGDRVKWGRLGTELNFTGTDGDGNKCLSPRRALLYTYLGTFDHYHMGFFSPRKTLTVGHSGWSAPAPEIITHFY